MFKNARIYTLTENNTPMVEEAALKELAFTPCKAQQAESIGFVPLYNDRYIHELGKRQLFKLKVQEKILPMQVVNETLQEKVESLDRKVSRKEKGEMKDEIIFDLLPKAFLKSSYIMGFIDHSAKRIVIDQSGERRAEMLLDMLREALGSLPVEPMGGNSEVLTDWLAIDRPEQVTLNGECVLKNEDGETIRVKQEEVDSDEVCAHIESNGYMVSKLAVAYDERIQFTIGDDFCLSKIKLNVDTDGEVSDNKVDKLDADFALFAYEFDRLMNEFEEWF